MLPWLGNLSHLAPIGDFAQPPYGEEDNKTPFPVRPSDRRSYAQNCVVWIKASGLQVQYAHTYHRNIVRTTLMHDIFTVSEETNKKKNYWCPYEIYKNNITEIYILMIVIDLIYYFDISLINWFIWLYWLYCVSGWYTKNIETCSKTARKTTTFLQGMCLYILVVLDFRHKTHITQATRTQL